MKNRYWELIDKISGMKFKVKDNSDILSISSDLEKEYKKENIITELKKDIKKENTYLLDVKE